jgi:hypothetical protein
MGMLHVGIYRHAACHLWLNVTIRVCMFNRFKSKHYIDMCVSFVNSNFVVVATRPTKLMPQIDTLLVRHDLELFAEAP